MVTQIKSEQVQTACSLPGSGLPVRSPFFVIVFNFRYLFGFSTREQCQLHPAMRKYKRGLRRNLQAVFPDTAPNSMLRRGEARCPLPQAAPTQAHQPVSRKAAAHRWTVRKHAQKPFGIVHPPAFQAAPYTFPIRVFRFRCVRSCKCCLRFSKATRRLSEALQPPFRGNSPVHPGRRLSAIAVPETSTKFPRASGPTFKIMFPPFETHSTSFFITSAADL